MVKSINTMKKSFFAMIFVMAVSILPAAAQETAIKVVPHIDFGNTAWIMVATALVMLMTIPGLALFYGGLVRRKNVLSILIQCFIIMALVSIEWVIVGYSLSFSSSTGPLAPYIGGFHWAFLNNIGMND